jgi:hypothetical protein
MANAVYSLLTALLCYIAVIFLIDQQLLKPRPYKVAWAIGLFVYGNGGLAQFLGTAGHWTEMDYRLWYLNGAILAAPYLGLGTLYLLAPRKWADRVMAVVAVFTVYAIARVFSTDLAPRTNWLPAGESVSHWLATAPADAVVNAGQHPLMPNDIVLVIIILNSLGALALVGGAAWSAWRFLRSRTNPTRLTSMILLVIGGLAPTSAGSLTKLGVSGAFYLLTFVGALFLLAGYLVSIDVFTVFRVPFTEHVLISRQATPALATSGAVSNAVIVGAALHAPKMQAVPAHSAITPRVPIAPARRVSTAKGARVRPTTSRPVTPLKKTR